nr:WD repeat-containing protein 54-like [Onthophagus taurus]
MYKHEKCITLVTTASSFNQNLALLNVDEELSAEALAVVHESFINVIPVLYPHRRSKYVPLCDGEERGKGLIKQVKWVKLNGETYFIVLSNIGLQVYDAELIELKYFHACNEIGDDKNYTIGICVIKDEILCVGTHLGTVWMFRPNENNNSKFNVISRFYAHDEAVLLMDGYEDYMVTSSDMMTYMWVHKTKGFDIIRKLHVPGLFSKPSSLKVTNCLTFMGYDSGEFCIFDFFDEDYLSRTIGHKLKITAIDFSALTGYILTGSQDCYVKVWKFKQSLPEAQLLFSVLNEDGPICGAAFLNHTCTQFCAVAVDAININVYCKLEKENDTNVVDVEENEIEKIDDFPIIV